MFTKTRHLVMVSGTTKLKFHRHLILRSAEYTQVYNLAHYEKRLDIPHPLPFCDEIKTVLIFT